MRQIKFRGKMKEDPNLWVNGYYQCLFDEKSQEYIHTITYQFFESPSMDYPYPSCHTISHEVIPETVGWFTGLIDKNGKEVYEGDICNVPDELRNTHTVGKDIKHLVYWSNRHAAFQLKIFMEGKYWTNRQVYEGNPFEVIGNIHDNPDRIK